ncbi:MAG TPA: 16S rRNA (adenine(1518)-N(6)/adenine(1519)-N(6))-dimethyltransferase RsmA [Opitutales bacterium]|nr:16S rRNA (adenine(1518)-N(6)/adenine(1519)-N(6))-dimethyltransferase RsmA [Opitutales bacterium]
MPLSLSETISLLRELGQNPRGSLGQNFLVDANIVAKSLALAEVKAADTVVEVGPGLGTLTRALLEAGADVYAIELDLKLHAYLERELVPKHPQTFHLMQGDAVDRPLAGLPENLPFKVVANLPYAISSPWMEALFSHNPLPERMVLMLQSEAADRYMAVPGTKSFGAISIFVQAAFERRPGHKVSAGCFYPSPEVGSQLLHLERKPGARVLSSASRAAIRKIFQQRRKQLGALCRGESPLEAWLASLGNKFGLDPRTRPEAVPVEAWMLLEEHLVNP